jgi:hypothetical protein
MIEPVYLLDTAPSPIATIIQILPGRLGLLPPPQAGVMAISSPDLKAFLLATPFFGGLSNASLDLLIPILVERPL